MLETVSAYIEQHQLLPATGRVIVAVSGGADSLCLLHILHRLCGPGKRFPGIHLHVAHLNHQLRGTASEQDALAIERLATAWGLPVTLGRIDVPTLARQEKRSLEDAARTARYRFLRAVAQGQPIAVAHHQDDQLETLVLHWLRGGGIDSMLGLQPRQQDIIRPLLAVTRADTQAYCRAEQLEPLEDASNTDTRFLRNRIRHELLPTLAEINPGIRETLLRNAEIMRVDATWIEQQIDEHWPAVVTNEQAIAIALSTIRLLELPLSLQRHLIRRVTARLNAGQSPLELRHHLLIEELMQTAQSRAERRLHMPQHIDVVLTGTTLIFTHVEQRDHKPTGAVSTYEETMLSIPGQIAVAGTSWLAGAELVDNEEVLAALQREDWDNVWHLLPVEPYTVYIDGTLAGATLQVRTRQNGDRIQPLGMTHEKKVQDILVDRHIPRSEREQIPLFFSAEHCIWLAGISIDERVRLNRKTRQILRLSLRHLLI